MTTRTRALLAALVGGLLALASCAAPAPPSPPVPGARVLVARHVSARTWDLTVDSAALGKSVSARLLLPTRYDAEPGRRWPVLYVLHGCCDDYLSWTRSTDIEQLTRDAGLIVAMPDGGDVGFYSDWLRGPAWETFHTVELPALLADGYRAGERQGVLGVSMGGLGAFDYAAHHPGRYAVAAAVSGIVHTRLSEDTEQDYRGLLRGQGVADPDDLWGNPYADPARWADHNPYDQAERLRGTTIFLAAGDGRPGPLDAPGTGFDSIESSIGAQNRSFAGHLHDLGIPATVDLYGPGTHNWVYWQRELHRAWPLIRTALQLP